MMIQINFTGVEGTRYSRAYGKPEMCRANPDTCTTPLIDPNCYSSSSEVKRPTTEGKRVGECPPPPSPIAWHPSRSSRTGSWLPADDAVLDEFIVHLRNRTSSVGDVDYIQPIKSFQLVVEQSPNLLSQFNQAFAQASALKKGVNTFGAPAVQNFTEFLSLLNGLMQVAPAYYLDPNKQPGDPADEPAGMIAFPINALLVWPMATEQGYGLFANQLVNDGFQYVLNHWQTSFLTTSASRYVLPATAAAFPDGDLPPNSVGWLHEGAKKQMVAVAFNFVGPDTDVNATAENVHHATPRSHAAAAAVSPVPRCCASSAVAA